MDGNKRVSSDFHTFPITVTHTFQKEIEKKTYQLSYLFGAVTVPVGTGHFRGHCSLQFSVIIKIYG